jgi:hypothetical protein
MIGLRCCAFLIAAALTLEALTGAPLRGQVVQGRVLTLPGESPVAGALVTLVDTASREVARAASSQSGGFTLRARGPGKYVVVVRQIGYQPWYSASLTLSSGATYPLTLRIEPVPYALPTITVEARRPHCGIRLEDEGVVSRLLDVARTALALAEAAAASDSLSFSTVAYSARLTDMLQMAESTSTISRMADWPIQSADPNSLRDHGFVHSTNSIEGPIYFGPDARVLFSDWFLASHCFRVGEEERGVLPVRFAPQKRPPADMVDIEGKLLIDSRTLELRRFEFSYVGLPRWVPRGKAGGTVWVQRLRGGPWVPHAWRIRAPVPAIKQARAGTRLDGWMEAGGRVTAVRGANGELDSALTRELVGGEQ